MKNPQAELAQALASFVDSFATLVGTIDRVLLANLPPDEDPVELTEDDPVDYC